MSNVRVGDKLYAVLDHSPHHRDVTVSKLGTKWIWRTFENRQIRVCPESLTIQDGADETVGQCFLSSQHFENTQHWEKLWLRIYRAKGQIAEQIHKGAISQDDLASVADSLFK